MVSQVPVYSCTSLGAVSSSSRVKASRGIVFTLSFWSTTGTGITSAKSSWGPR